MTLAFIDAFLQRHSLSLLIRRSNKNIQETLSQRHSLSKKPSHNHTLFQRNPLSKILFLNDILSQWDSLSQRLSH